MSVRDDEKLACEVQKFLCLYNKSLKSYKDHLPKKNAWRLIDESLGKPGGSSKHEWALLLNRYSKKRSNFRKANVSGAKESDVAKAQKSLDEYKFLGWIDCFIRPKATKSNVGNAGDIPLEIDAEESSVDLTQSIGSGDSFAELRPAGMEKEQVPVAKKRRLNQEDMFEQICIYLKDKKRAKEQATRTVDSDDVFGNMVSVELKSFPEHIKFMAKHEINQVIYKHKIILHESTASSTRSTAAAPPPPSWSCNQPQTSGLNSDDLPQVFYNN